MAKLKITADQSQRLKHVNLEGLKSGQFDFPDFLIIGPQRTGTTWLYKNLSYHPRIFIPPEKELFFFSCLIKKESHPLYTSDQLAWYVKKFSSRPFSAMANFLTTNAANLFALRSLKSVNLNLAKYLSADLVKGEATASYAAMQDSLIHEIFILNPAMRVIMFIRNPIERAWSAAKKNLLRDVSRSFDEVSFEAFKEFYSRDYQVRCGHYTKIIQQWSNHLAKEKFFIGFFDDIHNRPVELLFDVFKFLGVPSEPALVNRLAAQSVLNATMDMGMPPNHLDFLNRLFEDEIQELNRSFGMQW